MPLLQPTKDLLRYLQQNPAVRAQIRAAPGRTLLYAGTFFRPIWQELLWLKQRDPQLAQKEVLPEVLARVRVAGTPHASLLAWAQVLDAQQPWAENGFIAWRALSGIFAANAVGAVSFSVGSPVTAANKVFAATEVSVLARNRNVDPTTPSWWPAFSTAFGSGKTTSTWASSRGRQRTCRCGGETA
jgi:hypothetical protein